MFYFAAISRWKTAREGGRPSCSRDGSIRGGSAELKVQLSKRAETRTSQRRPTSGVFKSL